MKGETGVSCVLESLVEWKAVSRLLLTAANQVDRIQGLLILVYV